MTTVQLLSEMLMLMAQLWSGRVWFVRDCVEKYGYGVGIHARSTVQVLTVEIYYVVFESVP